MRDFAKLWCFKLILTKPELLKNQLGCHFSDVITITSPKNVTKITSQKFSILSPPKQNFWLRQWIRVIVISYFQLKVIVIEKLKGCNYNCN